MSPDPLRTGGVCGRDYYSHTHTHTHTHHLLYAVQNGLRPAPDNLHLECSYHLHFSHRFLSTWGVVMLKKEETKCANQRSGMESNIHAELAVRK